MSRLKRVASRFPKLARLLQSSAGRQGLRHGVGAAIEHSGALSSLSLRTIVDIGANKGQFALFCLDRFPQATVYAFEPLADPAARFRRVFADRPSTVLCQVAIGPTDGVATMHISRRDDSSSLLPIGELQSRLFPGTDEAAVETVNVGRLNTYLASGSIEPPALLKLDVQGFELEALQGCSDLLHQFDHVYVECSFVELYEGQHLAPDVVSYLSDHGFGLIDEFNAVADREFGPIQADLLFQRDVRPSSDD